MHHYPGFSDSSWFFLNARSRWRTRLECRQMYLFNMMFPNLLVNSRPTNVYSSHGRTATCGIRTRLHQYAEDNLCLRSYCRNWYSNWVVFCLFDLCWSLVKSQPASSTPSQPPSCAFWFQLSVGQTSLSSQLLTSDATSSWTLIHNVGLCVVVFFRQRSKESTSASWPKIWWTCLWLVSFLCKQTVCLVLIVNEEKKAELTLWSAQSFLSLYTVMLTKI